MNRRREPHRPNKPNLKSLKYEVCWEYVFSSWKEKKSKNLFEKAKCQCSSRGRLLLYTKLAHYTFPRSRWLSDTYNNPQNYLRKKASARR